jgi:LPXTG-motif cell wall-anchored protein
MQYIQLLSEEIPNTELSWLLYLAFGFFFFVVIVGWLVSRRKNS